MLPGGGRHFHYEVHYELPRGGGQFGGGTFPLHYECAGKKIARAGNKKHTLRCEFLLEFRPGFEPTTFDLSFLCADQPDHRGG